MKSERLTQFESEVEQVWKRRKMERLSGWHGYSIGGESGHVMLTLYVLPRSDTRDLKAELASIDSTAKLEMKEMEQFEHSSTPAVGSEPAPAIVPVPLLPGATVLAASPSCPDSSPGTIGAFLRLVGSRDPRPWLLSNHHVLVKREDCLPGVVVKSDGVTVGTTVKHVPLSPIGNNKVDAAVARVEDPGVIAQFVYPPEIGHIQKEPVPLIPGQNVIKFGSSLPQLTSGTVGNSSKFLVKDPVNLTFNEFINQFIIQSSSKKPFSCQGDSGSLVFHNGHPAGLLIADTGKDPCSTEGLATPFQTVLDEFEKSRGMKFELIP